MDNRIQIPIVWGWVEAIPQPRWLKRWYYRKSYEWWNHPSNHHWKKGCLPRIGCDDCFVEKAPSGLWKWWMKKRMLLPGERDIWTGGYMTDESELEG